MAQPLKAPRVHDASQSDWDRLVRDIDQRLSQLESSFRLRVRHGAGDPVELALDALTVVTTLVGQQMRCVLPRVNASDTGRLSGVIRANGVGTVTVHAAAGVTIDAADSVTMPAAAGTLLFVCVDRVWFTVRAVS